MGSSAPKTLSASITEEAVASPSASSSSRVLSARQRQQRRASFVAAPEPLSQKLRSRRTARRLFDTGAIFGVGAPEALTVGLLAWFLLGPEELYKLAKQFGGWLGDLRGYVGQAAQQYEKALDDEATKKAIVGIRQTQKQVLEVAGSWKSVADTLRDPLNVGKSLESTFSKLDAEEAKDLLAKKASERAQGKISDDEEDEDELELERMRAASRAAVADAWAKVGEDAPKATASTSSSSTASVTERPKTAEAAIARLNDRLEELDDMVERLQTLRVGLVEDRKSVQEFLKAEKEKPDGVAVGSAASKKVTATPVN